MELSKKLLFKHKKTNKNGSTEIYYIYRIQYDNKINIRFGYYNIIDNNYYDNIICEVSESSVKTLIPILQNEKII